MNDQQLTVRAEAVSPIVARVPITVRAGTMADLPFIDRLQKAHSRELGFLPTAALEGKVRLGQVLIAEVGSGKRVAGSEEASAFSALPATHFPLPTSRYPLLPP